MSLSWNELKHGFVSKINSYNPQIILKKLIKFISKDDKMPHLEFENTIAKELKEIFASSHINFLLGSGLSVGMIPILNDIEDKLNKAEELNDPDGIYDIKKEIFEQIIYPNTDILLDKSKNKTVQENYNSFIEIIYDLIYRRDSNLLHKQINIFTTNYDMFLEIAFEKNIVNFNDGFLGRINPSFNSNNYNKSYQQKSIFLEKEFEVPSINLYKIHGSISWKLTDTIIYLKHREQIIEDIAALEKTKGTRDQFIDLYNKLILINPSNKKFKNTLFDTNYYDLLRIFANEMEHLNTSLFVLGFSFADKHIKDLVIRAANSNPTLKIYIFVYDDKKAIFDTISKKAQNNNVHLIQHQDIQYDLNNIINVFKQIKK